MGFSKNSITVLTKRYLKRDVEGNVLETPEDMLHRVADTIAGADCIFDAKAAVGDTSARFYQMMVDLDFMPNSPTLMNAGRELGQLSACFVLPVGDSIEDIFDAVKYTAMIHKSGGGTGFSFSRLRPASDPVMSTAGISSGPVSFMRAFDTATDVIKQGGTRRGANMGILRIDHPDIMKFIQCKDNQKDFNNFNISVGLTEPFMQAVDAGTDYDLINPRTKRPQGTLNAREVFDRIVNQAWSNGEPGIVFLDRMNADNPTPQIGEIEATNPCGEQPLLPYESCNLGSINLGRFVMEDGEVDWDRLKEVVSEAVHFLDNVIEVNRYPLPQIDEITRGNRKIGLGVMGWADMLIKRGIPYDSSEAIVEAEKVMKFIHHVGWATSKNLAKSRGAFPNFPGSALENNGHDPMRNATITTIAPTGTISIICGASSGVEPLFAVVYKRSVLDNEVLYEVHPLFEEVAKNRGFWSEDLLRKIDEMGTLKGIEEIPLDVQELFVTSHDISPEAHIRMQAAFQRYTDNAVSKTVNFCNSATIQDVEKVYRLAYELNCKGVTIYRDGSRDLQVLSTGATDKAQNKATVAEEKPAKRVRPKALKGRTYQMQTGCGPLYVTINEDSKGLFEVFTTMGKAGGCAASQCEAIGRMVSLAWRSGVQARQVVKQLLGISCHQQMGFGENKILSCADAVAKAIQMHMQLSGEDMSLPQVAANRSGACPECGGVMQHEGGCEICQSCFYTHCS